MLATYGYDDLRRRTSVTLGNGAAQAYSYDAVSRLASLTNDLSGTANDLSVTFAYNPASQITQTVRSGDAYAFGNANTNTTTVSNGLNELVTVGGVAAAYDGDGDFTTDPASAKTYAYDSENKLKTASGGVSAYYDPVGRIAEYDTNVSSRFMSDGSEVVVEVDNPGSNIVRRFVRGDGPDELIAWYEGSGTTSRRFAGLDERNSIVSATDGSGSLIGINAYDEYGIPASSNIGRMQYTGQMWLPEAGVTYSKARNYLPSSGVFAQTDPIRTDGGVNLYGYVLNDPVNLADPSGLVCDAYTWVCGHRLPDLSSWWEFLNHNFFEPPRRRIDNFIDIFEKPPQKGPGHFYQSKKLLCTVAPGKPCHIERTGSEVCVIPGHISTEQVISGDWYAAYGSYGDLMPGGFVTTERTGPHSYRNTTTWAHPLSGTVDRIFTQDRSGNIYVTTIGQGTAATALQDSANQKRGPEIFAQQDELCSAILGGK